MEITTTVTDKRKNWLNNMDYSMNSIENYSSDVALFFNYIKIKKWVFTVSTEDITYEVIEDRKTYLATVKTPTNSIYYKTKTYISPSTIQTKITAVKSILKYLNEIYDVAIDYKRIHQKRVKTPPVSVLSENEFQKLLSWIWLIEKFRINCLRSQLLVDLWYTSWMRLSEMLSLKVEDIYKKRTMITWKWNKDRWVFFTPSVIHLLDEYLEERSKPIPWTWKIEDPSPYVFISHNSWYDFWYPIKKNTMCEIMKKYSDSLNFGKRITCHTLRHSYATRLLESWMNLKEIQELLGHCDLKTTEGYCHVLRSNLEEKVSKIFN